MDWYKVGPFLLEAAKLHTDQHQFLIKLKFLEMMVPTMQIIFLSRVEILTYRYRQGQQKMVWHQVEMEYYLISSANNIQQLEHFTTSNSNLCYQTIVKSIAINDNTGEVFFGTRQRICAPTKVTSTTINAKVTKDNVWAYPNPVRPDYTGDITITGISL